MLASSFRNQETPGEGLYSSRLTQSVSFHATMHYFVLNARISLGHLFLSCFQEDMFPIGTCLPLLYMRMAGGPLQRRPWIIP